MEKSALGNKEGIIMNNSCDVILEIKDLNFKYPSASDSNLKNINLKIYQGEFILITGPTGCGKSTLCQIFTGIIPHLSSGSLEGEIIVDGLNTKENAVSELSRHIGIVFQDPDSQIFSLKVEDEITFGPENIGLSHEEIENRFNQAVEWVRIRPILNSLTLALSGGQKQKVSLASSLAMLPTIMVLDGPITDLDPVSKQMVISILFHLKTNLGITFIIAEHDYGKFLEIADKMIVMNNGEIIFEGNPRKIIWENYDYLKKIGINLPKYIELMKLIKEKGHGTEEYPITYTETFNYIEKNIDKIFKFNNQKITQKIKNKDKIVISIKDLWFAYRQKEYILQGINLDIFEGEFIAIIGANGSGKSTLAKNLIGLVKPTKGDISIYELNTRKSDITEITKYVGFLFQNPGSQLFTHSVKAEMEFGLKIKKIEPQKIEEMVDETLNQLGIKKYKTRHPLSLSRGECKRLAAASVLLTDPKIVILDEPTTGQDKKNLFVLMDLMKKLNEKGGTIIMITHNMDLVAEYATRVIVIKDGQIALEGSPRDIFIENFDKLVEWQLSPPPIPRFSYELRSKGFPPLLTLEEIKTILK